MAGGGASPTSAQTSRVSISARELKRRARGAPKNDRTCYGRSPLSTRSFVAHHSQQISKAAVLGDANEVLKAIHKLKRRAYLCAASAPAVAGGARA